MFAKKTDYGTRIHVTDGAVGFAGTKIWNGGTVVGGLDAPCISPHNVKTNGLSQLVSISNSNSGVKIFYTLDGSIPSTNETSHCSLYVAPFEVISNVTVRALLLHEGLQIMDSSDIEFCANERMINIDGEFWKPREVSISNCDLQTTQVYFTLDGSSPLKHGQLYEAPFAITETTSVRAIAKRANGVLSKEVAQTFVRTWYTVQTPMIESAGKTFASASQTVTLSCETDGATIYYTIDGSEPSAANGRVYKGPFDIFQTTTVKAIAVKDDWRDSAVVSATFTKENVIGPAINLLEVLPDNDKTHPWEVVTDVTHDGVSAVKSGSIGDEESTTLKAVIYGAGRLSFWWRTSCEPAIDGEYYDFATFFNGTTEVARLAGATDWQQVTLDVVGTGKHTFKWTYQKDDSGSTVPDGVWLNQVQWLPQTDDYYSTHMLTTETPVPYTWIDKYGLGRLTDFESAAKTKSGKVDGAGRELTVEEEYIAGTDPTNAMSQLKAFVDLSDGYPKVTWDPDLNEDGTKAIRTYKVWGKKTLDDGAGWLWPTNALHLFFRVTVEMP